MTADAAPAVASPTEAFARFEQRRRGRLLRSRLTALAWVLGFSALFTLSLQVGGFFSADVSGDPLARMGQFLTRMIPHLEPDKLLEGRQTPGSLAHWYYDAPLWLARCVETVEMAILGTAVGAAMALPLAFLTARNVMPFTGVRLGVRGGFEFFRTIPEVILALILSAAFGVGPMAGVLTLLIGSTGSLGKLFAETIETAETGPIEAVRSAGGGWLAAMRYGVLPQILPTLVSYVLLRFEINLAVAAALGIVGAGGIGVELDRVLTYAEFDAYLAILLMIITIIFIADMASEFIRHRLIGLGRGGR